MSSGEEFAFDNINNLAVLAILGASSDSTNLACGSTGIEGLRNRRKQLGNSGLERDGKMIKARLRKQYKKACTGAQNKREKIVKVRL